MVKFNLFLFCTLIFFNFNCFSNSKIKSDDFLNYLSPLHWNKANGCFAVGALTKNTQIETAVDTSLKAFNFGKPTGVDNNYLISPGNYNSLLKSNSKIDTKRFIPLEWALILSHDFDIAMNFRNLTLADSLAKELVQTMCGKYSSSSVSEALDVSNNKTEKDIAEKIHHKIGLKLSTLLKIKCVFGAENQNDANNNNVALKNPDSFPEWTPICSTETSSASAGFSSSISGRIHNAAKFGVKKSVEKFNTFVDNKNAGFECRISVPEVKLDKAEEAQISALFLADIAEYGKKKILNAFDNQNNLPTAGNDYSNVDAGIYFNNDSYVCGFLSTLFFDILHGNVNKCREIPQKMKKLFPNETSAGGEEDSAYTEKSFTTNTHLLILSFMYGYNLYNLTGNQNDDIEDPYAPITIVGNPVGNHFMPIIWGNNAAANKRKNMLWEKDVIKDKKKVINTTNQYNIFDEINEMGENPLTSKFYQTYFK